MLKDSCTTTYLPNLPLNPFTQSASRKEEKKNPRFYDTTLRKEAKNRDIKKRRRNIRKETTKEKIKHNTHASIKGWNRTQTLVRRHRSSMSGRPTKVAPRTIARHVACLLSFFFFVEFWILIRSTAMAVGDRQQTDEYLCQTLDPVTWNCIPQDEENCVHLYPYAMFIFWIKGGNFRIGIRYGWTKMHKKKIWYQFYGICNFERVWW